MKKSLLFLFAGFLLPAMIPKIAVAQNPLITNQYTADPSARVFNGRVYVYPSHDIRAQPGKGRVGWFCMEDYHVFSSSNLSDWTDHGMIVKQTQIPWADPAAYSMWAPDCIFRNGKYYFYFPATVKGDGERKPFGIGVAVADKPAGPFVPQPEAIKGVRGIDPNVFIDKDGQAYLYWSQGNIYGAKLKDNMLELATEPKTLGELPDKGLKEGPYLFERKGIYYLTYPHVAGKTERLEYATSNSPLGPFTFKGVIMDESASGCWTNHHSIINFKDQWYLFYHDKDLSPTFDKNRSIRADSLFFEEDGSIRKVMPTLRGVGVTSANKQIQIDRYSAISEEGVTVNFIDTANRFKGWEISLQGKGSWVRYNKVEFKTGTAKKLSLMAMGPAGAQVGIYAGGPRGKLITRLSLKDSKNWALTSYPVCNAVKGIHDLYIVLENETPVNIDWVKFL